MLGARWEKAARINRLKEDAREVPLTVPVRAKKYRALMKLAHLAGRESLIFIRGRQLFDCNECPVREAFCRAIDDVIDTAGREVADFACYGAFMKWLFEKEGRP